MACSTRVVLGSTDTAARVKTALHPKFVQVEKRLAVLTAQGQKHLGDEFNVRLVCNVPRASPPIHQTRLPVVVQEQEQEQELTPYPR